MTREEAIDILKRNNPNNIAIRAGSEDLFDRRNEAFSMAIEALKNRSKQGHWTLLDECTNAGYYCSECRKKVIKEGWSKTIKQIKFCPNCGTRMTERVDKI